MKMGVKQTILCLVLVLSQVSLILSETCTEENCKIENNCRCPSNKSPIDINETPQLINLSFDEGVTENSVVDDWEKLLYERVNPDKESISATFFVPHVGTDYTRVNDLYNYGFEIGVQGISTDETVNYWESSDKDVLIKEFDGEKQIISKFSNIPIEDIIGVRTPQGAINGDETYNAYVNANFTYDSTWVAYSNATLFPYTLDFSRDSDTCIKPDKCPSQAYKGFWVVPVNNILGPDDSECNVLSSCLNGTSTDITNFLAKVVRDNLNATRTPLTFRVTSAWFSDISGARNGFSKFLDLLSTDDEFKQKVYLVSQKRILDWIKDPVPLANFTSNTGLFNRRCNYNNCGYPIGSSTAYINVCTSCPANYPTLDNPLGL